MDVLNFILLILGAIGLSHIIADSSIVAKFKYWLVYKTIPSADPDEPAEIVKRFAKVPEEGKKPVVGFMESSVDLLVSMMNCHQCNGFWSGIAAFGFYYIGWNLPLWAFAISLLSPMWAAIYVVVLNFTAYEEEEIDSDDDGGEDEE